MTPNFSIQPNFFLTSDKRGTATWQGVEREYSLAQSFRQITCGFPNPVNSYGNCYLISTFFQYQCYAIVYNNIYCPHRALLLTVCYSYKCFCIIIWPGLCTVVFINLLHFCWSAISLEMTLLWTLMADCIPCWTDFASIVNIVCPYIIGYYHM